MGTDTGIQADTLDNRTGVEPLDFGVSIEFIEIAHAEGEVGVGEEFDGLRFGRAHIEDRDVFLDGPFDEKAGEDPGFFRKASFIPFRDSDDDPAREQIVIKGFGLAEKLRGEEDIPAAGLGADPLGEPDRDGRLDDHHGVRIHRDDGPDNGFDGRGVEVVSDGVIVRRGCDDDKVGTAVSFGGVEGRTKMQVLLCQVFLDILVLDRRLLPVDRFHPFRDDIDRHDVMVLRQQRRKTHPDISRSGNCDFHILQNLIIFKGTTFPPKCKIPALIRAASSG